MADEIVTFPVVMKRFRLPDPITVAVRPWIIRGFLMRGCITEIVAPTSTGKSMFALALAAHLSAGRSYGPLPIRKKFKVAIVSAEEDASEIERRMLAAAQAFEFERTDLFEIFTVGFAQNLAVLGTADRKGVVHPTKVAEEIERIAFREEIDVLILDPLIELWTGNENDNSQMRQIIALVRDIAKRTEMAVMLTHHSGKGAFAPGDLHAGRGASAAGGAVRFGYTLMNMSADDAKALCIKPEEAVNKRRLDRAKANYLQPANQTDWFELVDFDIGNGTLEELADHAGAMVPWTPKPIFDGVSYEAIDAVLDMIEAGMPPDGIRFSKDETAKDRWVVPHMTALDEIWTEDRARAAIKTWLASELIKSDICKLQGRQPAKGLYVDQSKRPSRHVQSF